MIKLLLVIFTTLLLFLSYNVNVSKANCTSNLSGYFSENSKHEAQLVVIRPSGEVVYANNTLYYYFGSLTNGNSFPAVFSTKTKCDTSTGKVQLFDANQSVPSFYDRSGIVLYPDGRLLLSPIWGSFWTTNLTCVGSGGAGSINYGWSNGVLITLQFKS